MFFSTIFCQRLLSSGTYVEASSIRWRVLGLFYIISDIWWFVKLDQVFALKFWGICSEFLLKNYIACIFNCQIENTTFFSATRCFASTANSARLLRYESKWENWYQISNIETKNPIIFFGHRSLIYFTNSRSALVPLSTLLQLIEVYE